VSSRILCTSDDLFWYIAVNNVLFGIDYVFVWNSSPLKCLVFVYCTGKGSCDGPIPRPGVSNRVSVSPCMCVCLCVIGWNSNHLHLL
jgi:hypothetical protein